LVRQYKYLTFQDRKQIAVWYQNADRVVTIAERLGFSAAAVYRELKRGEVLDDDGNVVLDRNQRRAYNPVIAQQRTQENFRRRGKTAAAQEGVQ
jgi:IS30 family transposase